MNFINNTLAQNKKYIVVGFFALLIIIGFFIYKDYGLSWDETISHMNGQVSLDYISGNNSDLWTYSERYYGTIIEMPFAWAQKVFQIESSQQLFFFRHIVSFLLFIVGVFFFYLLCLKRFKSWGLALLSSAFLVLSPRIFADAFYNSKDVPFLVFFIISIYTLASFLEKPTWSRIFWHALASAVLIAIRIPGIFILFLTVGIILLDFIMLPEFRKEWRRTIILLGTYLGMAVGLTILFWPFLWQQPIAHFVEAFADMSRFSRQVDMRVFYFGEFLTASKIPWHYVPVWIFITTPFLYLVFFFTGIGAIIKSFSRDLVHKYRDHKLDLVVLGWFLGPLTAVIVFRSILYDGWRHLYFIYPALIYLGLIGFEMILSIIEKYGLDIQKLLKNIIIFIISAQLVFVLYFMIRSHPYQNVYFNFLTGGLEKARQNFDLDYWGLSFREGLEYIASHDKDDIIPVYFAGGSYDNTFILAPEVANRFAVLGQKDIAKAKYVLSNYRWQTYDILPHDRAVYTVKVDGADIMSVFKVR